MSEADFNWVEAWAVCSPAKVFTDLFRGVKDDVNKVNALPPSDESPIVRRVFDADTNSSGKYFAAFQVGNVNALVEFFLRGDHIEIKTSKNAAPIAVAVALDNEGKCKLRMNDGECMEQWQVRKIALEELFRSR
jgi:hypothetical protein